MPEDSSNITPALVAGIASGDEKSFALLFDLYSPQVLHAAYLFTHSREQSRDILQDVFMKLWLKRTDLPQIENLDNWIFVITRNLSLTALSKIARIDLTGESLADYIPVLGPSVESKLEAEQIRGLVQDALKILPAQQRRVFELSKLEHLSREEVAEVMGISPNTVKVHLLQATRTVRAFLLARLDYLTVWVLFHYYF